YIQTQKYKPSGQNDLRAILEFLEVIETGESVPKPHGEMLSIAVERRDPLEVEPLDVEVYVAWLDRVRTNLKVSTKRKYLQYVKSFYDWLQYEMERRGLPFDHPLKTMKYINLREENAVPQEKVRKLVPVEKFPEIIRLARAKNFEKYVATLLLIHDGPRVAELLNTRWADVNLDECYFETPFKKTERHNPTGRMQLFPFPRRLRVTLKQYIGYIRAKYPGNPYLFPSPVRPGRPLTTHALQQFFNKHVAPRVGLPGLNTHWFRHSLNTYRKYGTLHLRGEKCPKDFRQKLRNDSERDAEGVYDGAYIDEIRKVYDYYHPYRGF
ncbi:MAG: tyrosine-type recombinase/integrase, partial [Promethearchaeota archaeon]